MKLIQIHLKKLIPCLSIGVIASTPILMTTSCSCSFELHLTEHEQYVYDRTFSILGMGTSQYVTGTGWIISDATKDKADDYVYWLATNWHVTHGMDDIYANQIYYADNSMTFVTPYIKTDSYLPFSSFQKENVEKFVYTDTITTQYWQAAIDLNVIKVDFGSPTGSVKTKLDNLNNFQKTNGYINKFAKDDATIRAKDKIIGGYPLKRNGNTALGCQWETHSFAGSNLQYVKKGAKPDGTNCGHAIGDPMYNQLGENIGGKDWAFNYWDIAPQYQFISPTDLSFMSGGASGSMMITKDYEVCGIYWGGWYEDDKYFYPSFSLFNTDDRNFLEDYI